MSHGTPQVPDSGLLWEHWPLGQNSCVAEHCPKISYVVVVPVGTAIALFSVSVSLIRTRTSGSGSYEQTGVRAGMLEPRREAMTGFADAAPVEAAASAKRERRKEAIAALEQG